MNEAPAAPGGHRPTAWVVGAHLPRGGAYMAYHLGLVLQRRLGYRAVAVQARGETAHHGTFEYPVAIPQVPLEGFRRRIAGDDVVVANPLFSDQLFGLTARGTRLMWVQGVSTHGVIDGFFDHYAAVSGFVARHLRLVYGIDAPVLRPFVHLERVPAGPPFLERPPERVLAFGKVYGERLLRAFLARLDERHGIRPEVTSVEGWAHQRLLDEMARHRWFLALGPVEGCPLTPLEAMAAGCCVAGFHGGGGLEYLEPGRNSLVAGYPDLDGAVDALAAAWREPERAAALAATGPAVAAGFSHERFESAWVAHLAGRVADASTGGGG